MRKYPLIGASIIVVVLIVLGSLNNIVGYQTVRASNQKIINSEIDQKELLFQTIVDMMNNKEIQKVILGSELTGKKFFDPGIKFAVFAPPVLTEKFLKCIYTLGVILFRTLSKLKIHSMIERHHVNNQLVQKEISAVIQKDSKLKSEMTQLSSLSCDCGNENTTSWNYPFICTLVLIIYSILFFISLLFIFGFITALLVVIAKYIDQKLNCWWEIIGGEP